MLAFKAQEIEELADVYFFRPLGMVLALAARAARLTPIAVTCIGMAVGIGGGWLLRDAATAMAGFGLIILHSILDSSDGQLARLTGRTSELGRVLDGVGGYVTHVAIYLALMLRLGVFDGHASLGLVAVAAALCNIVHAQMYDYHRSSYMRCAIDGRPEHDRLSEPAGRAAPMVLRWYEGMQRRLAGLHPEVEGALAEEVRTGHRAREARDAYRACFYWPVRGWNLLGDNTRFYLIGLVAWFGRPAWFFLAVLLPMNIALAALWFWQRRADRKFLTRVW